MQPTVDEILEGVEISFRRDILPEVQSDWGRRISAALLDAVGHVRLRLSLAEDLAREEYADLGVLLALLSSGGAMATARPAADVPLDGPTIGELEARTLALRRTLTAIIRDYPRPDASDAGWVEILGYLGRQLDREGRLIPAQV